MVTPQSVTPKSERRHYHIRHCQKSVPPEQQQQHQEGMEEEMDSSHNQNSDGLCCTADGLMHRSNPNGGRCSFYHQICTINNGGAIRPAERPSPMMAEENAEHSVKSAVLIYKMQLLHCIEVAIKRILFHLVKTGALFPNVFRTLPFLLFALTLLLFLVFPQPKLISFPFPADSLQFGSDPNSGGCLFSAFFVHSKGRERAPFPEDNPMFDALQKGSPAEFAIILSTGKSDGSVLPPSSNGTALAFIELFERIQRITVQHQKQIYKWYDVCHQCWLDPTLGHLLKNDLGWDYPESAVVDEAVPLSVENQSLSIKSLFVAGTLGDVELDPGNGRTLRRARSLLMRIKLKPQLKLPILASFEKRLRRIVSNWTRHETSDKVNVHFWSAQQWSEEVERALRNVHLKMLFSLPFLVILLALAGIKRNAYEVFLLFKKGTLLVVSALGGRIQVALGKHSGLERVVLLSLTTLWSRPFLYFQIGLSLSMSVLFLYAVHIVGTGHLNPLLFPVPYFLLSIGFLVFFSLDGCLHRYSGIAMHPTEKMAFIFIWDGPCLVLSLVILTTLCVLSAISLDNPLLMQSLLAFSAGFVSLLLFSLFLTVCWLQYAQRVASGLKWFQFWRKGDRTYIEKQIFDYDARTCACLHEKLTDTRPCFPRSLGALAHNHNFRMIGFAAFTVCCFAAFVWNKPKTNLEMGHFIPRGADSAAFLDKFRQTFPKSDQYLELDFEGPLDYEEHKALIFSLLQWPLEARLASKSVSWLVEFDKFRKGVDYRIDEDSMLPLITHAFLPATRFRKFSADIRISQGQIHRSRMYLEITEEGLINRDHLMRQLLARSHQVGLPLVLKAPFSFNPGHDLQVPHRVYSALFSLCLLCALLNILQPATALCLLLSNVFLCASVNTIVQYFDVPLNIVTLSPVLFGVLLNSAFVIHFSYHFFNSGHRQLKSKQRVEYAFQCTFWPMLFAALIGPSCFAVQLLFGQYPPIVLHVWKVIIACSFVTILQNLAVLPGLCILFTDYFHFLFTCAARLCDDNANVELTIDPMSENVYFVPSYSCSTAGPNPISSAIGGGGGYGRVFYPPIESYPFPSLCMPPAYVPPQIDFPRKSLAQHAIQQYGQHSSQSSRGNSPQLGGVRGSSDQQQQQKAPTPWYSPSSRGENNEKNISGRKGTCGGNSGSSRNESFESSWSAADLRHNRIQRCVSHTSTQLPQHKINGRPIIRTKTPNNKVANDEQIYEEPDSPQMIARGRRTNSRGFEEGTLPSSFS